MDRIGCAVINLVDLLAYIYIERMLLFLIIIEKGCQMKYFIENSIYLFLEMCELCIKVTFDQKAYLATQRLGNVTDKNSKSIPTKTSMCRHY